MQPSSSIRRAALALDYSCDNACVFCAQAGIEVEPDDPRQALIELRKDHDEISFVGGEPALDARLLELVGLARDLAFSAIGLQTNAGRLASDPSLFDQLVATGLSDLHLSIHGLSPAAHDYHTGRPGSLAACLKLLDRAQRAGLTIVASTVVTRSNFRELPKLPPALKRRGVAGWLIESVRPFGRAADGFARVVPRFGMALPWALHGLEQARRHDLSSWIRGAPLCALGPFAGSALAGSDRSTRAREVVGEPCSNCASLARCGGVDSAYVEVFGSKELSAREARPLAEFDEGRARLIRMFVGIGPLIAREPQLRSPPAEHQPPADESSSTPGKNRRLPVLPNHPDDPAQSDHDS